MKILPIRLFNDFDININLYELIYWSMFFLFIEYMFPILLDPLGLTNEFLGYELDEWLEILILFIFPVFVIYFGDTVSGFHYIISFFFYGLISAPFNWILHEMVSDIIGIIFVLLFFDELIESQVDNEGDFVEDIEDFSYTYIEKIS